MSTTAANFIDKSLEPVTAALTPELAQQIVSIKPASDVAARVAELGRKSNEGTLTADEHAEYTTLANVGTVIELLQSRARRYLANQ